VFSFLELIQPHEPLTLNDTPVWHAAWSCAFIMR